jgi:hypothetical protein
MIQGNRTWKYKVGDSVYYRTGDDTEFAKIEQRRPCEYGSSRNYYRLDTGVIREESTLKQATRFEDLTNVLKASIEQEKLNRIF